MTQHQDLSSGSSRGSPPAMAPDDSSLDAPEGFDEIENAFAQVSMVADALLDSIQDDSLRGKERKRERKSSRLVDMTNFITDLDDDIKDEQAMKDEQVVAHYTRNYSHESDENDELNGYNNSYDCGNESDASTIGDMTFNDGDESIDGSLVHDVHNLKSVTRAMQAEMQKQEEAFNANVTTDNGKSFFQKLEDAKAAEDAKTPRMKNNESRPPPVLNVRPTAISVRNGSSRVPILTSSSEKQKRPSFLEQLQQLCTQLLGTKPNLPMLVANLVVWLFFIKLVFVAREGLIKDDGRLQMVFSS